MKINSQKIISLMSSQGITNTYLAESAGISRQSLQGILKKKWPEVRAGTLRGLVRALKLPDESVLSADPLAGYKGLVAKEHADLDFRGLGLPVAEPRQLDDLFVPVRVSEVIERERDEACTKQLATTAQEPCEPSLAVEEDGGEYSLGECLARNQRLLLRGEPGSGKTTVLRHVARSYARGSQKEDGYPRSTLVPLLIGLADYSKAREHENDLTLVRFVLMRLQPKMAVDAAIVLEGLLEKALENGRCLVLLDGLDEVGSDGGIPEALRNFVQAYPKNQFVLTSRAVGLDTTQWNRLDFKTCAIARWREEDIRRFALGWYTSRNGKSGNRRQKENERQAKALSAALLDQRPLREIATNPLMLTILAALHHANAQLPRRRVELYEKVVEVLIETWEAGKRDALPGNPLHGIILQPREFEWLLSRVALDLQRQDQTLAPRWRVADLVQQFLRDSIGLGDTEAKDQGQRVLRHLCERSGLLVERGADIFGFSHRSFQEYFAARGIVEESANGRDDPVALLQPYLYHPRWAEVIRLVSAQIPPARATALIRTILDDPDPAGRFLNRGRRLTLRCLADGAVVSDRQVLNQILVPGDRLGQSKWLGITFDLIEGLTDLRATRHAADANRMLEEIESGARRALSGDEFLALYVKIHGPLRFANRADDRPGTVHTRRLGGHKLSIISVGERLLRESPEKWRTAMLDFLRMQDGDPSVKRGLIEDIVGRLAKTDDDVRLALEELLESDCRPQVRAACAEALRSVAASRTETTDLLLRRLEIDESDMVRGECAEALRRVAPVREDVRDRLKALQSSEAEVIRAGAAWGLVQTAPVDKGHFNFCIARAQSAGESPRVRIACLYTVEESLGQDTVDGCFLNCLDDTSAPLIQRVAAQIVAGALADNRWAWSPSLVGKVESILMAVSNPCPHTLEALERLESVKEIRGGMRLERVLGNALAALGERVTLAFVFGSVARQEQSQESDIDLLTLGEVRLKELVPVLHTAERGLGRTINPVLYTSQSFAEKYQAGDPFLLEIVRNKKLFLKGQADDLRDLVAERLHC